MSHLTYIESVYWAWLGWAGRIPGQKIAHGAKVEGVAEMTAAAAAGAGPRGRGEWGMVGREGGEGRRMTAWAGDVARPTDGVVGGR